MQPPERDELEELLTGLPVREPSRMLDERVAASLTMRQRVPWAPLAVAAGLLIIGAVTLAVVFGPVAQEPGGSPAVAQEPAVKPDNTPDNTPDDPSDGPTLQPVGNKPKTVNLVWKRDLSEEMRYTSTGQPYRAIVREAVDHKAWHDPETGVTRQLCIPREELIVVKQMVF